MRKRLWLRITVWTLLLAAAIVALLVWRWDIFFTVSTERSYTLRMSVGEPVMTAGEDGIADRSVSWTAATADSCLFILEGPEGELDTLVSRGTFVKTMGGDQYMHQVRLTGLQPGSYCYHIECCGVQMHGLPFIIRDAASVDLLRFCLFGDLLFSDSAKPMALNIVKQVEDSCRFDAMLYTGNIVRESTHADWSAWLRSMYMTQSCLPQLGVPGSRDYERGIGRVIDPRWQHRFPMPLNGPDRFLGTTCFIDYPLCRLIFLDTETLEHLADYTVLQTWLAMTLTEASDKWKIVVMHHSVHSASAGFDHPRLYAALHHTLDDADLICSGNDLTYGRRCDISLSDYYYDQLTAPVYIVLTSDSTEAAVPKCSPLDQRIGSNRAFFSTISVAIDRLEVATRYLAYPDSLYDGFTIDFATKVISECDSLPAEVIELPENHADGGIRARRFEHLRDARMRRMAEE